MVSFPSTPLRLPTAMMETLDGISAFHGSVNALR
jgi:hypothetical protein